MYFGGVFVVGGVDGVGGWHCVSVYTLQEGLVFSSLNRRGPLVVSLQQV